MADAKVESKADKDRRQALELALSQIERQFGKGAVMKLGAAGALEETSVISTGALSVDLALGVGGLPRGRITEIYGPESSGKTTLALHVIAEAQRQGGYAAFIDAEHALDAQYAKRLGVKASRARGTSSISRWTRGSSRRAGPGSRTGTSGSVRVGTTPGSSSRRTPR
jgi:RecA/RadA recombinase